MSADAGKSFSKNVAELLFVMEVSNTFADLTKATEEPVRRIAEKAVKSAQVFQSVVDASNE